MTIREMNFDDIAEIAEIEKLYSETPWDANGLLTYLLRDDTIFLVADSLDFVPVEGEAPEEPPVPPVIPETGDATSIAAMATAALAGIASVTAGLVLRRREN